MIAPSRNRGLIGLDVTARHVAAAQLNTNGALVTATRFRRIEHGPTLTDREAHRIRDVLDRQGFSGRQIALGVPDTKLLWSSATLPPRSSGAPIASLAHAELARHSARSPEMIESGCWDLPASLRTAETTQVIAAGCPHEDALDFLKPFDLAGFETACLEPRPCAAAAACNPASSAQTGLVALIEIGERSSSPHLINMGLPIYHRSTPEIGLNTLMHEIATKLGFDRDTCEYLIDQMIDPIGYDFDAGWAMADIARLIAEFFDRLSRELRTALNYASYCCPDLEMSRVLLAGDGARLPGMREHVGQEIGKSPTIATLSALTDCPAHLIHMADDPAMMTALGLARIGGDQ